MAVQRLLIKLVSPISTNVPLLQAKKPTNYFASVATTSRPNTRCCLGITCATVLKLTPVLSPTQPSCAQHLKATRRTVKCTKKWLHKLQGFTLMLLVSWSSLAKQKTKNLLALARSVLTSYEPN